MPTAAVFGSSTAVPEDRCCVHAYELGRGLARLGFAVKNGGYQGVMEAVTKGVVDAGGTAIGVTLTGIGDSRAPTPHLSIEIPSPDLLARLRILTEDTDVFFAMETGGPGTLNEVFLVWAMTILGEIEGRPLVLVGSGWPELVDLLTERFRAGRGLTGALRLAPDVESALAIAERIAGR